MEKPEDDTVSLPDDEIDHHDHHDVDHDDDEGDVSAEDDEEEAESEDDTMLMQLDRDLKNAYTYVRPVLRGLSLPDVPSDLVSDLSDDDDH